MHEAEILLYGGSLAAVLGYVASSDTLTVLPETVALSMGPIYGLRPVPIETRTPTRPLGILSRPTAELGNAARAFIGHLKDSVAALRNSRPSRSPASRSE